MKNQRLRNLTTGRLHTKMDDIYKDVEYITGEEGVMTHMLPRAFRAMQPFLKAKVTDPKFWDGKYDPTHEGDFEIEPMNEQEKKEFWELYEAQPNPLFGKPVIVVKT